MSEQVEIKLTAERLTEEETKELMEKEFTNMNFLSTRMHDTTFMPEAVVVINNSNKIYLLPMSLKKVE